MILKMKDLYVLSFICIMVKSKSFIVETGKRKYLIKTEGNPKHSTRPFKIKTPSHFEHSKDYALDFEFRQFGIKGKKKENAECTATEECEAHLVCGYSNLCEIGGEEG